MNVAGRVFGFRMKGLLFGVLFSGFKVIVFKVFGFCR